MRANSLTGADWLKHSFSIWREFRKDSDAIDHPAPFPVALASQVIDCFVANRKGILLDPFAGAGSALLAALRIGMGAVGFDINPTYRDVFIRRLETLDVQADDRWEYHIADSRSLKTSVDLNSIEFCFTSPPYWDILRRRRTADGRVTTPYSTSDFDLGNIEDYQHFLAALAIISSQVGAALRPRGYFVMNVMDIRKGRHFYALHQDANAAVLESGYFTLEDIIIWDRQADYNAMRPLGFPYKFIINKVHEYLLVFRKKDQGSDG